MHYDHLVENYLKKMILNFDGSFWFGTLKPKVQTDQLWFASICGEIQKTDERPLFKALKAILN